MSQFAKRSAETPKDADELFGSFVASQLRKMTAEQNAIARFQINQLCFQIKMSGMGLPPSAYNSSQVSAGQTFHPLQVSFPYTAPEHIVLPFDGGNVTNPPCIHEFSILSFLFILLDNLCFSRLNSRHTHHVVSSSILYSIST